MSATEQAVFEIQVNGAQAKQELAAIRGEVDSLGGGLPSMAAGLARVETAFNNLHKVTRQTSQGIMALSLVMGESTNEQAKMFREASHLATAFAIGGPVVGGVTAAIGVLNILGESLSNADAGFHAFGDATKAMGDAMQAGGAAKIARMRDSLLQLEGELKHFGETAHQIAIDEQKFEHDAALRASTNLGQALFRQDARVSLLVADAKNALAAGDYERNQALQEQLEALRTTMDIEKGRLDLANDAVAVTRTEIEVTGQLVKKEKERADGGKSLAEEMKRYHDAINVLYREQKEREKEAGEILKESFEMKDAVHKREFENAKKMANAEDAIAQQNADFQKQCDDDVYQHKLKLDKETADRRAAESRQIAESLRADAENLAGAGVGAINTFIEASIAGHKYAAQEAEAAFAKQIGQQLVSMGIKDTFAGAGFMIAGDIPQGAAMLALGAAETAAGIGLGAVGAGIAKSIPTSPTAGVSGGGSLGNIHGGSGSSGSGGGSTSVTVVNYWGSGGPGADDYARATADQISRARRRRFLQ